MGRFAFVNEAAALDRARGGGVDDACHCRSVFLREQASTISP